MSRIVHLIVKIYRRLLLLYPTYYRAEFQDEMLEVFTQAIEDRSKHGLGKVWPFCLRELMDMPASLYRQRRAEAQRGTTTMTEYFNSGKLQETKEHPPGSWSAAFMAGLPHLIMGLLIASGKFIPASVAGQFPPSAALTLGLSLVAFVAAVLLVAWLKKWPLWSASWYGYVFFIVLGISTFIVSEVNPQESWRFTAWLYLLWVVIIGSGYFYMFFRDRIRALLAIFFLVPFLGVMTLEFIPDPLEGWIAISLGLLAALTAASIVRLGSYRITLALIISINAIGILTLAFVGEFMIRDLPPNAPTYSPTIANFLELLALYSIVALVLIGTPFLIQGLYDRKKPRLTQ